MKVSPLVNDNFGASVSISNTGYLVVGSNTKDIRQVRLPRSQRTRMALFSVLAVPVPVFHGNSSIDLVLTANSCRAAAP